MRHGLAFDLLAASLSFALMIYGSGRCFAIDFIYFKDIDLHHGLCITVNQRARMCYMSCISACKIGCDSIVVTCDNRKAGIGRNTTFYRTTVTALAKKSTMLGGIIQQSILNLHQCTLI